MDDIWDVFEITQTRGGKAHKVACRLCPPPVTPICANITRMRKHYTKKHEARRVVLRIESTQENGQEETQESQEDLATQGWHEEREEELPPLDDCSDEEDSPTQGVMVAPSRFLVVSLFLRMCSVSCSSCSLRGAHEEEAAFLYGRLGGPEVQQGQAG